ncbi:MAG: hypothetical protein IKB02_05670 [Clostridia bacterium]|nr:hypothetical protein [Clostridia bacterium]
MAYKRKYRKGEKITSLDELMKQEFVYFHDKILNYGFFGSWQIRLVKFYIQKGMLFYAEKAENDLKPSQNEIGLWIEGYAATGESSTAKFLGFYKASTLKEAVTEWLKENPQEEKYVNMERLSYWGCRFFDNETEARKSFG